jgi:imidazole glycerol-phosphate synthase subunit HisH
MIGIINFGLGNLGSIINSYYKLNTKVKILDKPPEVEGVTHLILPGVGSYRVGMNNLKNLRWDLEIFKHVKKKKPLLGICLGMQLLFEKGEEDGINPGLGLIKGSVSKIKNTKQKIPVVGWKDIQIIKEHKLLHKVRTSADFYFIHSYECRVEDESNLIAKSGDITACVALDNIFATQFHPEKSPPNGTNILKNFYEWDGTC